MEIPEKLEALAQKMRDLESVVEKSKSHIDDAALGKLKAPINATLTVLEKAIDGMKYVVDRFFN